MKNSLKSEILVFALLLVTILVSRFVSHAWNFTAVGGVVLFSGAFFSRKWLATLVLFSGLLLSDAVIGFHQQMSGVYLGYLVMLGLGFTLTTKSSRAKTYLSATLASLLFFFITNAAVWFEGLLYPMTFDGLMQSYRMGIPFFKNQILADILTSVFLFELAKSEVPEAVAVRLKFR